MLALTAGLVHNQQIGDPGPPRPHERNQPFSGRLSEQLDPVPPGILGEEPSLPRERLIPIHANAGGEEAFGQSIERVGGDAQGRVRLQRWDELHRDPHVELLRAGAEPDASAPRQRLGFLELGETEQRSVEPTRFALGPRRSGHLDVVEPEDPHAQPS